MMEIFDDGWRIAIWSVTTGILVILGWSLYQRRATLRWFERPPQMPIWYWIIYWAIYVTGIVLWWWVPYRFSGFWLGAFNVVLIPLMWKKAPPHARPWVTLFLVGMAAALFWTAAVTW